MGNNSGGATANVSLKKEPKIVDVGQFAGDVSAYNVHDMGGNAGEWADGFYQPYEGNQIKNSDFGTKYRVVRGGSVKSTLEQARTTFRGHVPAEMPEYQKKKLLIGVRYAISANDPKIQETVRSRSK